VSQPGGRGEVGGVGSDGWQQFPGVSQGSIIKVEEAETVMNRERERRGREGNSKEYVIFIRRFQSLGHHSFIIDTFPIKFSTVLKSATSHTVIRNNVQIFCGRNFTCIKVLSRSLTYTNKKFQEWESMVDLDTFLGSSNFTAPVNKEMIPRGGKRTKRECKNGYNPNYQKSIVT
jgi:hypothetical protein